MKVYRLIALVFLIIILGCSDGNDDDFNLFSEQFQGKYEIVSAISSEAVDLNMDGTTSFDLLTEISEMNRAEVTLITDDKKKFFFTEHWPIEYIGVSDFFDSTRYDPSYSINYARYAIISEFKFSENNRELILIEAEPILDPNTGVVDKRFVFPDLIQIELDNSLRIVSTRNLFTFDGYKEVRIVARYRRYYPND